MLCDQVRGEAREGNEMVAADSSEECRDGWAAQASVMEEPLRLLLHLMLSRPEYQLG